MKILHLDKHPLDIESLRKREALAKDSRMFIQEPCSIYENGKLKVVYVYLDEKMPALVEALKTIPYEKSYRSGGLPTISRIFGYSPRSTLRKDFCASTSLSQEFPAQHAEICRGAKVVSDLYSIHNPDLYCRHEALSEEKVKSEWHLEDSPFTSGIANKDNQLRYHFDSGNFADVWSAMLVFKKDVEGGFLSVPEYDVCFELKDHSCLMFDGQGLLHGVTPFKKLTPEAYRYSIVYYSLRQMWNCLSPTDELMRIRKIKTQREFKRAGL
jgi:2-oxoglutarate-Fe(II)-dependent dioxygenase family protein